MLLPRLLASTTALASVLCLSSCGSLSDEEWAKPLGQPSLSGDTESEIFDKSDPLVRDSTPSAAPATSVSDAGLTPVGGRTGKFVIRDPGGNLRVDGQLKDGRMNDEWKYFDPTGRKLAVVNYKADSRSGAVTLYYVSSDGKAAGKKRMEGQYADGTMNGFIKNWNTSGNKVLERDFDRGILQGARAWDTRSEAMSDGEAMAAAIKESREEDSLLSELEAFVQLQIRKQAGETATAR